MLQRGTTKYVIAEKDQTFEVYLDEYDCGTSDISKAKMFDQYVDARDCRDNIDVAYLYEVCEVAISYIICKYVK